MTDLTLYTPDECFALAERVAKSSLMPQAYRGKPVDTAIAMLYGIEMGLSPMTALQRITVINGKPTLDAQGMVALVRQAGHSISGDITETEAKVTGKRGDTGDTMTSTFTMRDAELAGLARSQTYQKFPKDMLWARAVSQLCRRLFADVLMAASYGPEEMQAVVEDQQMTVRSEPTKAEQQLIVVEEVGEVLEAEIVEPPKSSSPAPKGAVGRKSTRVDRLRVLCKAKGYTAMNTPFGDIEKVTGRSLEHLDEMTEEEIEQFTGWLVEKESK